MDGEIAEYLKTAGEEARQHYEDYDGDQLPIVGAVYIYVYAKRWNAERK